MTWKEQLLSVRKEWYLENYQAARDIGVPAPRKPYNDTTSNGLTTCILDWLKFNGHYGNRINTQGQVRIEKIKLAHGNVRTNVRWTKGKTKKGTPDIDAIIRGKPVKIEVKINRDTMSDDQIEQMVAIQKAGGIYFIARNMEGFLQWYNTL